MRWLDESEDLVGVGGLGRIARVRGGDRRYREQGAPDRARRATGQPPIGAGKEEDHGVHGEELPGMRDDRIENTLDIRQCRDRDAHAVEGASRCLAGLQLLVTPAQRARQRVDPAERKRAEDPTQHERHRHDEERVERERKRLVEELVAQDLDGTHDERGHDDEEPTDAIGHLDLAADPAGGVPRGVARSIRRCWRGSDRRPGHAPPPPGPTLRRFSGRTLNRGVPSRRGA
jgi:hypothetical protein